MNRNTNIRDKHRRIIAHHEPPCGICGEPIDYTLPHLHPYAFVADHITPLARGGRDELANKQAAHRRPKMQPRQKRFTTRIIRRQHHHSDIPNHQNVVN